MKKREKTLHAIFTTVTIHIIKALILISMTIPLNHSNEIEFFGHLKNRTNAVPDNGSNITFNCEDICTEKYSTVNCDKMMISTEELFIWNNINWGLFCIVILQPMIYFFIQN